MKTTYSKTSICTPSPSMGEGWGEGDLHTKFTLPPTPSHQGREIIEKRHFIQTVYALILFCFIFYFPLSLYAAPPPDVRVLVIENEPAITISGNGWPIRMEVPEIKETADVGNSVTIKADKGNLTIDKMACGKMIVLSNVNNEYSIGQRQFLGKLTVVWKERDKLLVINTLPLERYLVGLIGSEIQTSWPPESIKAQAVAARTYALNSIQKKRNAGSRDPYDLTSTILSQVYHGAHVEDIRSSNAVDATRGEVLKRNGVIFPAFYHSCCGGQTEHAHNVWVGEEGSPVVPDKFCARSPKFSWKFEISLTTFINELNKNGANLTNVSSVSTTPFGDSPRAEYLVMEDTSGLRMVLATELRRIFGYTNIKSTWFDVNFSGNRISFSGKGYGHGVGLCQWGAKGMAEAGHAYRDILKFYYPDTEVVRIY